MCVCVYIYNVCIYVVLDFWSVKSILKAYLINLMLNHFFINLICLKHIVAGSCTNIFLTMYTVAHFLNQKVETEIMF